MIHQVSLALPNGFRVGAYRLEIISAALQRSRIVNRPECFL